MLLQYLSARALVRKRDKTYFCEKFPVARYVILVGRKSLQGTVVSMCTSSANWHLTVQAILLMNPSLAFEASTGPVDTSAQAALAPHQTTEQEESVDKTFMVM
jgi:hypothetical protein